VCVWKDGVRSWPRPDYSAAPHADAISMTASQKFGVIAGLDPRVARKARRLRISATCETVVFARRSGIALRLVMKRTG